MNEKMEQMISRDTGVDIGRIRKMAWTELERLPHKLKKKPFRPENMTIVGGNINLAENREMGMCLLELRNTCRKVAYTIKCLLKHRKNV